MYDYDCEWTQLKIDKRGNVWRLEIYAQLPANYVCYIILDILFSAKKKTLEVDQTSYPRSKAEGVLPRS